MFKSRILCSSQGMEKRFKFLQSIFVTSLLFCGSLASPPVTSLGDAEKYLEKYGGYVKSSSTTWSTAIKEFQNSAGLRITGNLDEPTLAMMNRLRCGVKDEVPPRRRKRYVFKGGKWPKYVLTYRIKDYPQKETLTRSQVDREIERGFQVWSQTANLRFVRKESGPVDIEIRFASGDHGDGIPFYGPGGTYAHAFYPRDGEGIHFDDDETWRISGGTDGEVNLFQLATHEIGHTLGLIHTREYDAVMYQFYIYQPRFTLHPDDVGGMQSLYGPPLAPGTPDLCQDASIQAATTTKDGRTYFFKGDYYWLIQRESRATNVAPGYPRRISDDWGGVPGNIDAALTRENGMTYIFKGHRFWRFENLNMYSGYPKNISREFSGIPDDIEAALTWSGNGKIYFFKGSNYWRYDIYKKQRSERVDPKYPQPISKWPGVPSHVTAAFQWDNQKTYFFKGDQYYKLDDRTHAVESGYPQSVAKSWLNCL